MSMYDRLISVFIQLSGYDSSKMGQNESEVRQEINIFISSIVCLCLLLLIGMLTRKGNEIFLYTFSWICLWLFKGKSNKGNSTLFSNLLYVGTLLIVIYTADILKYYEQSRFLVFGILALCGIMILFSLLKWKKLNIRVLFIWVLQSIFAIVFLYRERYGVGAVYSMLIFSGGMIVQSLAIIVEGTKFSEA